MTADRNVSSNRVIIAREGEVNLENQFYIGYSNDCGHCVSVIDGGKLNVGSHLRIGGADNTMFVSNGVVTVKDGTFHIGSSWDKGLNTRSKLEIAGAKTQIQTKDFQLWNNSTLQFNVPEDGFENVPLNVGGKVTHRSGCPIVIDAEAFQSKLDQATDVVLMTWTNSESAINENVINAANAELAPKKMKLVYDTDNKRLVLHVRSTKVRRGLILILR